MQALLPPVKCLCRPMPQTFRRCCTPPQARPGSVDWSEAAHSGPPRWEDDALRGGGPALDDARGRRLQQDVLQARATATKSLSFYLYDARCFEPASMWGPSGKCCIGNRQLASIVGWLPNCSYFVRMCATVTALGPTKRKKQTKQSGASRKRRCCNCATEENRFRCNCAPQITLQQMGPLGKKGSYRLAAVLYEGYQPLQVTYHGCIPWVQYTVYGTGVWTAV